ncbi:MAG TPA: GNAT family N-acetyltransferase [Sphingomonadaceae bacterium]|jgi:hypothetical protein|nr:GNAT family N-acetyltransferase [Sphingomonadaceae bacterium]
MRVKVEHFVDLDAVTADAAGALDPDAQARLYDTLDWYRLTRDHISPAVPLHVVRARGEAGAMWLFLAARGGGSADPFGSWYTLRYAPIFGGPPDPSLAVAALKALRKRFGRISLQPLAESDLLLLQNACKTAGWWSRHTVQTANWVAHTAGLDFPAYWAARPKQLQNTVRRKAAKAQIDIRLLDTFDPLAWDQYEAVFAASWKGGAEGSPAFLRALARHAAALGRLRMGLAYDPAGTPLAAQFWTVDAGIATIHKLAYVDAAKALSPGSILSHAMFEHVITRDRPAAIDFGTGDDPYKADWMDEKRSLHRLDAYNSASLRGLAAYARSEAGELVARWRSA